MPFVLVREAIGEDHAGGIIAWFLWRANACLGFVGASLTGNPFKGRAPLRTTGEIVIARSVAIWRSHITRGDHTDATHALYSLARLASRGLGQGFATYVEIARQLSVHGWALRAKPSAHSADARALWMRFRKAPGVHFARKKPDGVVLEFTVMLEGSPAFAAPGPVIAAPA